jgi:hypothetical protein
MSNFKFVARPNPYPDESLLGLLKRHSSMLIDCSPSSLAASFGWRGDIRGLPLAADIGPMKAAYGDAGDHLEQMRFEPRGAKTFSYRGHVLHRYDINLFSARICPVCVAEAKYHRQYWCFSYAHVCQVHNVRLIDQCSHCSAKLSWYSSNLGSCAECGARVRPSENKDVHPGAAIATRALTKVLDGNRGDLPDVLAELPFSGILNFLSLVGRMACDAAGIPSRPGRSWGWHHADQVLARGHEVALGWPDAFHAILDCLAQRRSEASGDLLSMFGVNYRAISRAASSDWGRPIYSAFATFVSTRFGMPEKGHSCGLRRPDCVDSLRERLRLTKGAMRRLKGTAAWSAGCNGSSRVSPDELERLQRGIDGLCNARGLGLLLGLHVKKQIKEILDAGVFGPCGRGLDGRARVIDRGPVEAFLARLEAFIFGSNFQRGSERLVAWPELRRMAAERRISLPELVVAIKDEHIHPVAGGVTQGLRGALFVKRDATAELDRMATERFGTASIREVADELGVPLTAAYAWVCAGTISPYQSGQSIRGVRISISEVDRIRKEVGLIDQMS